MEIQNEEIKQYIEKQPPLQRELLIKLREIFIAALPDCEESFQWGAIVYQKGKFYLAAMKTRVHAGFAINGLNDEEIKRFEGNGKTMRHLKITAVKDIDECKLQSLIRLVDKKSVCVK